MAEHDLTEPLIGVAADGTGYGLDGAIWGGEIMVADCRNFERVAHLAYVPLPGGEQAIKQPWRMSAVYLQHTFGDDFLNLDIPFVQQLDHQKWRPIAQMIARGLNSPPTSSFGRLFDAVSALLGLRSEAIYEGQAAIELEMLAQPTDEAYPFAITDGTPAQLDLRPTIRAIVVEILQGVGLSLIAGRFQRTMAELITAVCLQVYHQTRLNRVALSGGVFQNRLLLEQTIPLLQNKGLQVYTNRQVPPNDGGISLGQAAIAAATIQ
jgi:hydrogenase maturation protein HypF